MALPDWINRKTDIGRGQNLRIIHLCDRRALGIRVQFDIPRKPLSDGDVSSGHLPLVERSG